MYCGNCGQHVGESADVCSNCSVAQPVRRHTGRTIEISADALESLTDWRGPAVGAAFVVAAGIALALVANIVVVASIHGAGLHLPLALGLLLFGSFGVKSVGSQHASVDLGEFGAAGSVHYSVSLTLLGAFLFMLAAVVVGGRIAARQSRTRVGATVLGLKTAAVVGTLTFLGSFGLSYGGMHPQHFEALLFPFLFAAILAPFGVRIERDGRQFWRLPVESFRDARPELIKALGVGFESLVRMLRLTTVASLIALVVLAAKYPHAAHALLGGRRLIAFVLLLPVWLPHVVGLLFVASQGIAFQVSGGSSLPGTTASASTSIFGSTHGLHLPMFLTLAVALPIVAGVSGGQLAASRISGDARDRTIGAVIASIPFLVCTWVLAILIGIKVDAGASVVGGAAGFGASTAGAIFWPLLWGPVLYAVGAVIRMARDGGLSEIASRYAVRVAVAPSAAVPPSPTCPRCEDARRSGKRFCTACGRQLV